MTETERSRAPIRIGISACLLGEPVRHDGGHKHDRFLTDTLGRFFEWVSICPEVEVGMGTPREAIHLLRDGSQIRLVGTRTRTDHTDTMRKYARHRVRQLSALDLSGFILKKNSPSCGLERVRVHDDKGPVTQTGRGLFAAELADQLPNLPIEEEGRLREPRLRENWIERVFAYHRLQALWAARWRIGDLIALHTSHKLLLLAHSPRAYQELGRLVAAAQPPPRRDLREQYEREFMAALTTPATRGRHANVLQHMVGHFRRQLDDASRCELADAIDDYRRGLMPLIVPITLIAHYARLYDVTYLKGQAYLNPHPKELALRHHV